MSTLEEVWAYREEMLYPRLFGTLSRGIFPLDAQLFEDVFGTQDVDPRWLFLGVMEFAPTPERLSWLYVTSGGSTPWEIEPDDYDPQEYSWLGSELVIEIPRQANWAIQLLRRLLAFNVLLCHGRFGDAPPLNYGDRIPARGGVAPGSDSKLDFIAIAQPSHYEAVGQLDSGIFDFLHIVGITEDERDFAKSTSTEDLIAKLAENGAYPVTMPGRTSTMR